MKIFFYRYLVLTNKSSFKWSRHQQNVDLNLSYLHITIYFDLNKILLDQLEKQSFLEF